jgi:hypothetical protein
MESMMEHDELTEAPPGVEAGPGRVITLDGRLESTLLLLVLVTVVVVADGVEVAGEAILGM